MAELSYREWRLFIGPPWRPHWDDHHYDWSVLDYGSTGDPAPLPSTILGNFLDGEVQCEIWTDDWPAEGGGFWVGPNGAGQGWEYCEYEFLTVQTYQLSNCTREPAADRDHNGDHTAGAPIQFWWPVDTVDGSSLNIEETMNGQWAAITWKAKIDGVLMPAKAIRNNHLALIQVRNSPADAWRNELVGWLASPRVRDDAARDAAWTVDILSSAAMANRHELAGITAGDMDIAQHGTAGGSLPLAHAYKERTSGDYVAAQPDFNHSSAIDADAGTLWIAEQYIGTSNWRDGNGDPHWTYNAGWNIDTRFVVSGICLQRPSGYNSQGYRYIELTAVTAADGLTSVQDCTIYTNDADNYVRADIGESDVGAGHKIILCEDESLFAEDNPINAAQSIIEINQSNAIGNINFWDNLDPAGGALALRRLDGNREWMHGVSWGTSNGWVVGDPGLPDEPPGSNDHDYWYWKPGDKLGSQTDPKPAAPAPGECLRYLFHDVDGGGDSPNAVDYWDTTTTMAAGYTVGEYGDDRSDPNAGIIKPTYFVCNLPVMPLVLRDDMGTTSGLNDKIFISDASGTNTGGLDAVGTIMVADEQIAYTTRTPEYITGITRGVNGTSPAAHLAGDPVRVVEGGGVATDAPPILSVGWDRAGGTIWPKNFWLFTSTDPDAATPENSVWTGDWVYEIGVSNHNADTWLHTFPTSKRIRRAMIVFEFMSEDPGRPRINEFHAYLDGTKYTSGSFLDADQDAGTVTAICLQNAGMPVAAVLDQSTGTQPLYTVTASDGGWTVASDVADFANLRVETGRDSKITIQNDSYWGAGSIVPADLWTRLEATAVEITATQGDPVRQALIAWRTPDNASSGTVRWPDEPETVGGMLELGELVYPNEATAQAAVEKLFYMRKYPYQVLVECALSQPDIRPGAIHQITWDVAGTTVDRYIMVESVAHRIQDQMWITVLTGMQIDRQSE